MRLVKISEVASLDPKETIPSIQGVLTKVYDYKSGEGDDGAWSMQVGSLKDSTGEIKVVIKNQNDMKGLLNREVLIKSHSGPKGLSGCYSDDNEWPKDSGKFTRQVKVTATAEISIVDASGKSEAPKVASDSASPQNEEAISPELEAKRLLIKVTNLMYLCERAVHAQMEQSKIDGIPVTDDNFGGKCGTAYRELKDAGLLHKMSAFPLWSAKEQLKEKPPEGDEW